MSGGLLSPRFGPRSSQLRAQRSTLQISQYIIWFNRVGPGAIVSQQPVVPSCSRPNICPYLRFLKLIKMLIGLSGLPLLENRELLHPLYALGVGANSRWQPVFPEDLLPLPIVTSITQQFLQQLTTVLVSWLRTLHLHFLIISTTCLVNSGRLWCTRVKRFYKASVSTPHK